MAIVLVDGQEIEIGDDERLNGIQVARRAGIEVPHYCWHPGLSVVASCRMCLVESGRRDPESGEISMIPKLVPACQTPATDNTVFVTNSEKVTNARAMVEEDLLIRHPIDCPICDKAGECSLQDYHFTHGREQRRADLKPFTSRRRPLGDTVTLFVDRCVMCSRCVRFCREVSGSSELMVVNRGAHEEIDVFPGYPLDNKLSGNVVDLCPVGALGDQDFLYQQRVWFMKNQPGVCAGCSTGCSIEVHQNQDRVYRLKPRENPHINHWWMCDEGRYGWKYLHDEHRLTQPQQRSGDQWEHAEWKTLLPELDRQLRQAAALAVVVSPFLTVEEAFLLGTYARTVNEAAQLVLGPVPQSGEDEQFPHGFTIRGEKCPNRQGVERVLSHFGPLASWETLGDQETPPTAIWVAGGYPEAPWSEQQADQLAAAELLVVQEMFASPLSERADYLLPAAGFAERAGSYVNATHRLQAFDWAIRPPAGVMVEGRLFWQLLERPGMYQAEQVREEVARAIGSFAAAAGAIPDQGVDLRVHQLA